MCACTDKTCADKVMEKMMKLGAEHAAVKGTEAQQKEAGKITAEAMKCVAKVMMPAGTAPAPLPPGR